MFSLLGLAVLVFDIIAIIDVFNSSKSAEKKALWVVLILVLPVVGMILYFLLGKKQ